MPVKNKDQENLFSYKVHFIDKSSETFHLKDDLLKALATPDAGGFHPLVFAKNEWMINVNNVLWIEDITQPPTEKAKPENKK